MSTEKQLSNSILRTLQGNYTRRAFKWERIENRVNSGTADGHLTLKGVTAWLELKVMRCIPPVRIDYGLHPAQQIWHQEMADAGAITGVLIGLEQPWRSYESQESAKLVFVPGRSARAVVMDTDPDFIRVAHGFTDLRMFFREVERWYDRTEFYSLRGSSGYGRDQSDAKKQP